MKYILNIFANPLELRELDIMSILLILLKIILEMKE